MEYRHSFRLEKESNEFNDLPFVGLSAISTTSNTVSESSHLRSPNSSVSVNETSLSQFRSKLIKTLTF
jgi:hypothetical protein